MRVVVTFIGVLAIMFGSLGAIANLALLAALGQPFNLIGFAGGSAIAACGLYAIRRYG